MWCTTDPPPTPPPLCACCRSLFVPAGETRIVWIDGRFSWQYGPYQVWLQFDPPPPPSPPPPSPPPPAPSIEDVLALTYANHNLGSPISATITGTLTGQPDLGFAPGIDVMYAWKPPQAGTLSLQGCTQGYGFMQVLDDQGYSWADQISDGVVEGCAGASSVLT